MTRRALPIAIVLVVLAAVPAFAYLKLGTRVQDRTASLKWGDFPINYYVTNRAAQGVSVQEFQTAGICTDCTPPCLRTGIIWPGMKRMFCGTTPIRSITRPAKPPTRNFRPFMSAAVFSGLLYQPPICAPVLPPGKLMML